MCATIKELEAGYDAPFCFGLLIKIGENVHQSQLGPWIFSEKLNV